MHLVVVSPFPPSITGIGQYGYHLTRALSNSGVFTRLTVLAGSTGHEQRHPSQGSPDVEYCWQPDSLQARPAILARIRQLNPDLIWFNLGASIFGRSALANLSGLLAPVSISARFPTIVTLHEVIELADLRALNAPGGILAPLGARLLTHLATRADVTCLTMQRYADWLRARGIDCTHIPIGAYHEPELLEEAPSPGLLFFTTLAPYKGLEILIEAFTSLRHEFPDLSLTVAGTSHPRFPGYAQDLRSRFGEAQGVRWRGQVAEDQVQELFRGARVVILPYTASTGSSSVLYQAATWGRPMVASALPEIQSLTVENDLQIQFFQTNNAESLCQSIRLLLNSPELRHAQAQHNHRSIQQLRPRATCARYIQAFNRALEKRQSAKRVPRLETS